MPHHEGIESPIDNQTYDLLQILTSKLESIEAYHMYEEDMSGNAKKVLEQIAQDEKRHIDQLVDLLGLSKK